MRTGILACQAGLALLVLAPAAIAAPKTNGGPGGIGATDGTSALELWLRPEPSFSDGQAVSEWSDHSGNANHVQQATGARQPINRAASYNGHAALELDGTDDHLIAVNLLSSLSAESVFVVQDQDALADMCAVGNAATGTYTMRHRGGGWEWAVAGFTDGVDALRSGPHGAVTTDLQMISAIRTVAGNAIAMYDQGGLLKSTTHTSGAVNQQYRIGSRSPNSEYLDGLMAEVIAFSTNLNDAERILVENYLNAKFFTSSSLVGRDFYAGDTPGNGDYDYDVCGIGRQDASNEATNGGMAGFGIEESGATLDDGDYVLAGHKETINVRVTDDVPPASGMVRRWSRVWYVDKTGTVDGTLAFDHTDAGLSAPAGGTDFALLYSATEAPYSFSALAIVESVTGDTVSFTLSDAQLLDGYYTLASDEAVPAASVITGGGPGGIGTTDGASALELWLKPDASLADGQAVSQWTDSSGNANHAAQGTAASQPLNRTASVNGLSAMDFDGADDYLVAATVLNSLSAESMFVVKDLDTLASHSCVVGNEASTAYTLRQRTDGWEWTIAGFTDGVDALRVPSSHGATTTDLQMISGVRTVAGNSIALWDQAGSIKSTTHTNGTVNQQYRIGSRSGGDPESTDGRISEVVAFSAALSTVQRYLVENYLHAKYFSTGTLTDRDFYSGNTPANGDYDYDVFGIGRLSAADEVTSAGSAALGIAAPWGLGNNNWVLAGHKEADASVTRVTEDVPPASGMVRRWSRVWYVDKTGAVDVTLSFDHTDAGLSAPAGGTDFALLYSATEAPYNFSAMAVTETVNGDTVSFYLPNAQFADGYYTLASDESPPTTSIITDGGPGGVGTTDGASALELWLKPDASLTDGQAVSQWTDSSGNANHAGQATPTNQPLNRTAAINGLSAMDFDGADDYLVAANTLSNLSAESMFAVKDFDALASHTCVVGNQASGTYTLRHRTDGWEWTIAGFDDGDNALRVPSSHGGAATTDLQLISGIRTVAGDSIALWDQAGSIKSTTLSSGTVNQQYRIGSRFGNTEWTDGLIGEVVAFSTNLSTAQRYLVENYLHAKYFSTGTLTGRDFYSGDTPANGDYDYDVFGIGRLSAADEVTSAGSAGLGIAAPWGLTDNEWVLAGHKTATNSVVSVTRPGASGARWARVWYLDITGTTDLRLTFDASDAGVPGGQTGVKLLYSATEPFTWSEVTADATTLGDQFQFLVEQANLQDGYYTVSFSSGLGTVIHFR